MLLVPTLDFTDTCYPAPMSLHWTQYMILAEDRGKHCLRGWCEEVRSSQWQFRVTICVLLPFWTALCRGSASASAQPSFLPPILAVSGRWCKEVLVANLWWFYGFGYWWTNWTPGCFLVGPCVWASTCSVRKPGPVLWSNVLMLSSSGRWLNHKGVRQKRINEWLGIKNENIDE